MYILLHIQIKTVVSEMKMLKKGVMLSKPGVNLYAQDMRSKNVIAVSSFKCIIKIGFCLQLATLRWHICLSSGNNSSVIGQESVNETLKIKKRL